MLMLRSVNAIIKQAEDIRVIVVGDDDQNIYEFRGSSSRYMKEFKEKYDSETYDGLPLVL